MAKAKVQLPKQWTAAKIRVNKAGKVQVKIAKSKVKTKVSARKAKRRKR